MIPMASFGICFLADLMMNVQSDLSGLLIMGMLLFGWPGTSAWLGIEAGKDLRRGWYLPVLFALTMPIVFPYGAGWLAWCYAGGILLVGLLTMLCTKVAQ